jgi:hypothetical protein
MNTLKIGDYSLTYIGNMSLGVDGQDAYYKVSNNVDEINIPLFRAMATEYFYSDTDRPGGYFCHGVSAYINTTDYKSHPHNLILVVHQRFNV